MAESDRSCLNIQLTPMRISETALESISQTVDFQSRASDAFSTTGAERGKIQQLVLYPGESSELLIQLENNGNQPIYFNHNDDIQVETDLPSDWYRLDYQGTQLSPREKTQIVFRCAIAADFFESPTSGQFGILPKLDYFGLINIRYRLQETLELNESESGISYLTKSEEFYLYIRPRSLYLNFLPDIYREVDFIGRWLAIFEQAFEPAVQALDVIHAYLNPRTAPEAMLPFLARWVGWRFIPGISYYRQRSLIHQALEIYRWRGTKYGLRFYLHLCTGLPLDEELQEDNKHISIKDTSQDRFVIEETRLGEDSVIGGSKPYHFVVSLNYENSEIDEQQVKQVVCQIIEEEKPAFSTYELLIKRSGVVQ